MCESFRFRDSTARLSRSDSFFALAAARLSAVRHANGSTNSGPLFLTPPTPGPTFHAFIRSASNGRKRSTGSCAGLPGSSHRFAGITRALAPKDVTPVCALQE